MPKYKAFAVNKMEHTSGASLQKDLNNFLDGCEFAFMEVYDVQIGEAQPATVFLAELRDPDEE